MKNTIIKQTLFSIISIIWRLGLSYFEKLTMDTNPSNCVDNCQRSLSLCCACFLKRTYGLDFDIVKFIWRFFELDSFNLNFIILFKFKNFWTWFKIGFNSMYTPPNVLLHEYKNLQQIKTTIYLCRYKVQQLNKFNIIVPLPFQTFLAKYFVFILF